MKPDPTIPPTISPVVGDQTRSFSVAGVSSHAATVSIDQREAGSTPHFRDHTTPQLPTIPGYSVEEHIGSGGYGDVYRVRDIALGRTVAIKILRSIFSSAGPEYRLFERERKILACIEHPNVVQVFASGTLEGRPYYVMRFVPGGRDSFAQWLRGAEIREIVRVFVNLARASEHFHALSILHRDLKIGNVMLDTQSRVPYIVDFGVARWNEDSDSEEHFTVGMSRVGTYAYMAPEIVRGGAVESGPESDLWAIGVMLYEACTGVRPFASASSKRLGQQICEEAPAAWGSLPDVRAGADGKLERIALQLLAKDPEQRHRTARALAEDLQRWLDGHAPSGPTLSDARRAASAPDAAPTTRRRRTGIVLAAGAASVLIGLGIAWAIIAKGKGITTTTPPIEKVSVADRLKAGGRIVIIDGKGKPLEDLSKTPGSEGAMEHQPEVDGYTLSTNRNLFLEIARIPRALPVRLSFEVWHQGFNDGSNTGGFAGYNAIHRDQYGMLAVMLDAAPHNAPRVRPGKVEFVFLRHRPTIQNSDWFSMGDGESRETRRSKFVEKKPEVDFRTVEFVTGSKSVVAQVEGIPFKPLSWDWLRQTAGSHLSLENRQILPEAEEHGLGIYSSGGIATFRNVTIEAAIRPQPPSE